MFGPLSIGLSLLLPLSPSNDWTPKRQNAGAPERPNARNVHEPCRSVKDSWLRMQQQFCESRGKTDRAVKKSRVCVQRQLMNLAGWSRMHGCGCNEIVRLSDGCFQWSYCGKACWGTELARLLRRVLGCLSRLPVVGRVFREG